VKGDSDSDKFETNPRHQADYYYLLFSQLIQEVRLPRPPHNMSDGEMIVYLMWLRGCYVFCAQGRSARNGPDRLPMLPFVGLRLHRVPISVETHLATAQVLAKERKKSARSEDMAVNAKKAEPHSAPPSTFLFLSKTPLG
jgi:hypothetical protein